VVRRLLLYLLTIVTYAACLTAWRALSFSGQCCTRACYAFAAFVYCHLRTHAGPRVWVSCSSDTLASAYRLLSCAFVTRALRREPRRAARARTTLMVACLR